MYIKKKKKNAQLTSDRNVDLFSRLIRHTRWDPCIKTDIRENWKVLAKKLNKYARLVLGGKAEKLTRIHIIYIEAL